MLVMLIFNSIIGFEGFFRMHFFFIRDFIRPNIIEKNKKTEIAKETYGITTF